MKDQEKTIKNQEKFARLTDRYSRLLERTTILRIQVHKLKEKKKELFRGI